MPQSQQDQPGRAHARRRPPHQARRGAQTRVDFGAFGSFNSHAASFFQLWDQVGRANVERFDALRVRMSDPSSNFTDLSRDTLQCWSDCWDDAAQLWTFCWPNQPGAGCCSEVFFRISQNDDTSSLRVVRIPFVFEGVAVSTPLVSQDGAHTIASDKVFLHFESASRLAVQLIDLRPPQQAPGDPDDAPRLAPGIYEGFVVLEQVEELLATIVVEVLAA